MGLQIEARRRRKDREIAGFKARWVVKVYLQQFGIDFDQTYAAVVKQMAFRVLFAIAAYFDLDIDQMDIKSAFLYGLIDQLIYVKLPKGTETEGTRDMVCKLLKALYGLKKSPRLWFPLGEAGFITYSRRSQHLHLNCWLEWPSSDCLC